MTRKSHHCRLKRMRRRAFRDSIGLGVPSAGCKSQRGRASSLYIARVQWRARPGYHLFWQITSHKKPGAKGDGWAVVGAKAARKKLKSAKVMCARFWGPAVRQWSGSSQHRYSQLSAFSLSSPGSPFNDSTSAAYCGS